MREQKQDELSQWFAHAYFSVRDQLDLDAYQQLDHSERPFQQRRAAKEDFRRRAGRMVLAEIFQDPDLYANLMRQIMKTALITQLKSNDSGGEGKAARLFIDDAFPRAGAPERGSRPASRPDDDELPQDAGPVDSALSPAVSPSDTYIPVEVLGTALLEFLYDPVYWGEFVCTPSRPDSPLGLVRRRFAQRLLDWMARHKAPDAPPTPTGAAAGGQTPAQLLDPAAEDYVAQQLALARKVDDSLAPEQKAEVFEVDDDLYTAALLVVLEFLAARKKRMKLAYRVAYILRKLFPEHAWAQSAQYQADLRALQAWLTDALQQVCAADTPEQWRQKLGAVASYLQARHRWALGDDFHTHSLTPMLDTLAAHHTDARLTLLPQPVVSVLIGALAPATLTAEDLEKPGSHAQRELRRVGTMISRPIGDLDRELRELLDQLIVSPLQARAQTTDAVP